MRRPFGPTIAERHLVSRDQEAARVRVSLGTPRWNGSEWECPFRIRSAGRSEVEFGRGLDSMQALTTAVEGIRVALESKFGALSWEGVFPHHSGFQRAIPLSLDVAFSRRVERLVDREFERHLRQLKQRNKRRTASKSGKRSSP
jgi:hypothetical protein